MITVTIRRWVPLDLKGAYLTDEYEASAEIQDRFAGLTERELADITTGREPARYVVEVIDRLIAEVEAKLSEAPDAGQLRDQLARLNKSINEQNTTSDRRQRTRPRRQDCSPFLEPSKRRAGCTCARPRANGRRDRGGRVRWAMRTAR